MRDGAEFPPVTLYDDGQRYWLANGHHRVHAARAIGREHIRAEIREGSREDAVLFGLGANATLPRTNADKRRSVTVALDLPKLAGKSDREIAAACAVSHTFVAAVRRELSGNGCQMPETREVTRGGTTYSMDVSTIGRKDEPEPDEKAAGSEPTGTGRVEPATNRPEPEVADEKSAGRPEPEEEEEPTHTEFVLDRLKTAFEL